MKFKIRTTVLIDKPDEEFVTYDEEVEILDSEVRHKFLCTMCKWSTYPECREWCPNGGEEK